VSDFRAPPSVEQAVVRRALDEDLGLLGDLTSTAIVPADAQGVGSITTRKAGVLAGTSAATEAFRQVDARVALDWHATDGTRITEGAELAKVEGATRSILVAERTALNLLCHLSGVATLTARYVEAIVGTNARIRDTRKTLPGLRALEKAAVRAGGGFNHRESLSDAVLIKDNHLTYLSLRDAVDQARARWPGRVVEVECDTLDQVAEAKTVAPDLVLLDNMTPVHVADRRRHPCGLGPGGGVGGVTLDSARGYAEAGADFISVGAVTHSAPALDIGLDLKVY